MLSINAATRSIRKFAVPFSLTFGSVFLTATPAHAQATRLLGISSPGDACVSADGSFYVDIDSGCDGSGFQNSTGFASGNATFDGATNSSVFSGGTVSFNTTTTAFGGGTATFNNTVSFTGPSVTFSTPTIFQNPATFNGTTDFTAGITAINITNSGGISTSTLTATTGLTVSAGANVNMGGNQIHGVVAGVAATDAVNVGQLTAATSGITADLTALETTTATHTTQIATLQTDLTAETAARIGADTALQTNIDTEAVTRAAADTAFQSSLTATNATVATHTSQITAIQAVNATQANQIGALEAGQASLIQDVDTLFDLRRRDRREARRGTAAAVAMSEAPMPSRDGGISYSLHGATYRGQFAVGGSLKYRVNGAVALDVGLSHAGHKDTAARVGISGEF